MIWTGYKFGRGYNGLAMFTKEKMPMRWNQQTIMFQSQRKDRQEGLKTLDLL